MIDRSIRYRLHRYCILIPALSLLSLLITGPLYSLEDTLNRSSFSVQHAQLILDIFSSAEQEGIDTDLLLPRLEEGLAKHMPATRIIQTLERDIDMLLRARSLLEESLPGTELLESRGNWARTANLLSAGKDPDEVLRLTLIGGKRPQVFRPASSLYVSLVDWGVAPESAMDLVQAAVESSLPGSEFPGIIEILIESRRLRLRTDFVISALIDELPNTQSMRRLRRRVLQQ